MSRGHIPFHRPHLTGRELHYIAEATTNGALAGDGEFTKRCHHWLEARTGAARALLTHSCTAALEMSALLAEIGPGDEVIMPSFTFVSTANAFVLRGAVPVFVDIREDTLNLDETLIESAITSRTKAIVPVHYAGVGCDMDTIIGIADAHRLCVIEDAAQGVLATYRGRPLGSMGDLGAYSFHGSKNIAAGEGGALLVNKESMGQRAEYIREKGTNRTAFFRGENKKYEWVDIGSSYLPGELVSAFLWAQLQQAEAITNRRLQLWQGYHDGLAGLEHAGSVRRPIVPDECRHNGHIYYLLLGDRGERDQFIQDMGERGIDCHFHYVPLHSSPAGRKMGRATSSLPNTTRTAERLVRLPISSQLEDAELEFVIDAIIDTL